MVKRLADKQLTDRNCDESDADQEIPLDGPMKIASPQAISKRQIRALPGRGAVKTSIGALKPEVPPSNPKTTWSLFDQASTSGKPVSTNLFGGPSHHDSSKVSLFGSSSTISPKPKSDLEKPKSKNYQAATKYYASLRGLNLSVLKAFQDLTEKDAFTNLSPGFDHIKTKYEQYRNQIQSEFDIATSSTAQKDQVNLSSTNGLSFTTVPFSFPTNSAHKASQEGTVSVNSSLLQSQSQSRPADNNAKGSPMAFSNGSTTHESKTGSARNPFAMAAPARPSPLRYENESVPAGSPESVDPTPKADSNVTFIPDKKPSTSLFSTQNTADLSLKSKPKSTEPSFTPISASTHLENKSNSFFGTPPTSTGSTSVFGAAAPKLSSFVSPQIPSSANKSPNIGFGFGVSSTTNGSIFGGFGAAKSSPTQATPPKNGFNPVGFSFGNSPPTSSTLSGKIPGPASSEKEITNTVTSASNDDIDALGSKAATQIENSSLETAGQPSAIPVSNKGEEDEETLYETSGRVYALLEKKQDDGSTSKGWVGWAVCNVKLNRHKETNKTRILARSQVNQGILINFFVRPDLKPENRGSSLEILGFTPQGTQLQAYRIRPSSEQAVSEFIVAIEQVVESLGKKKL